MLYLFDANVLIDANRDYYPIDRVPEFWEWLVYMGENDSVKIPIEIYEEIREGKIKDGEEVDPLAIWAKNPEYSKAILLDEDVDVSLVSRIVNEGYGNSLTDDQIDIIGRDPFLIAYAMKDIKARCVVTTEVSRPRRERQNRKIPDVCDDFGVKWCHTFEFTRKLNFRTNWKTT